MYKLYYITQYYFTTQLLILNIIIQVVTRECLKLIKKYSLFLFKIYAIQSNNSS